MGVLYEPYHRAHVTQVREVGSRPRQLRQNEKRPSKTVFLVEAAGKQVRKQLITVFHDAPEDFKELKERRLAERRIMTIKSSRRRTPRVRVPQEKGKKEPSNILLFE